MSTPARKHAFTATAEKTGNEVVLLLTGYIWPENENASAAIAAQLASVEDGDNLTLLIRNLYGGDTDEGIAIYHDLVSYKPNVKVDGVCASMGFPIMLAGADIEVSSHSKAMMHRPQGGYAGDFEDMRERADRNEACYNELAQIIATRTGIAVDQVKEQFMPKGKDVWFSPAKLLELKIANRVTKGSLLKSTVAMREAAKLRKPEDILERFTACLEEDEVNNVDPNKATPTMNKELLTKLGLPENATQEQYDAAVLALHTKATADAAALNDARTADKARLDNELKTTLDDLVKGNKMTAAARDGMLEKAKTGDVAAMLETVKAMGSGIAAHAPVSPQLVKDAATLKKEGERASWTFGDYQRKDSAALARMQKEDPAAFNALKEAHVKALRENQ